MILHPGQGTRAGYPPGPTPRTRNPAMTRRLAALTLFVLGTLSLALLANCGGPTPKELQEQSQAALNGGDYPKAIDLATQGLAAPGVAGDKALTWQFERVRLEALAAQGKAPEVLAHVARLSGAYADQLRADSYARLGQVANDAGQSLAALDIVEAGKQKFPDRSQDFDGLVADLKAKAVTDDALMAQLKSLGYL